MTDNRTWAGAQLRRGPLDGRRGGPDETRPQWGSGRARCDSHCSMTDRPWWAVALQWAAWGAVMTLVMGWLSRSRAAVPRGTDGLLQQPRSTLVIGWVCTLFFAALAGLSRAFPGQNPTIWSTVAFLLFSAGGLVLVAEYHRGRHRLTPEGLRYGKLLGRGGLARWDQVIEVCYSDAAKLFRLETSDGRVIRVSAMLTGLPDFASAALDNVSEGAIDRRAHEMLEATRRGELPSIWG